MGVQRKRHMNNRNPVLRMWGGNLQPPTSTLEPRASAAGEGAGRGRALLGLRVQELVQTVVKGRTESVTQVETEDSWVVRGHPQDILM